MSMDVARQRGIAVKEIFNVIISHRVLVVNIGYMTHSLEVSLLFAIYTVAGINARDLIQEIILSVVIREGILFFAQRRDLSS